MNEDPKNRLDQFRKPTRESNNQKSLLLLVAGLCLCLGMLGGTAVTFWYVGKIKPTQQGFPPDKLKEYALLLEDKGLPDKAIEVYKMYLERSTLDDNSRAAVCYSVGKLATEIEHYEDALAYFYLAEMLAPETNLRPEIDKQVLSCLEHLGRKNDLRKELRKRSSPSPSEQDGQNSRVILAEFPTGVITDKDLETELAKMPPGLREKMTKPEDKMELLKNLVAERLLLDKAFRLGIDKDPELENMLTKERDSLLVRKLLSKEVDAKIQITPEDVERYYKSEPERFTEPETAAVIICRKNSEEEKPADTDFSNEVITLTRGKDVPEELKSEEVLHAIFSSKPNDLLGPFRQNNQVIWIRVVSKKAAKHYALEEVRDTIEKLLRWEKQQELTRQLIDETLKSADVKFFPEQLEHIAK